MNLGKEFETRIISMTETGDGISNKDGMIVIVPGANVGQRVSVRVIKMEVTKVFCEVIDFLED